MLNSDLEVLQTAVQWLHAGKKVELVTLAKCWGSAPHPPGSLAVVREDGLVAGSVSGGCIEKQLSTLLRQNESSRLIRHKVSRDQAMRFGLTCGGELELVFERLEDTVELEEIIDRLGNRDFDIG